MNETHDTIKERLHRLERTFEYETDEELKRKREVYRAHVVGQTQDAIERGRKDLQFNTAAYEALSKIVQQRERRRLRREILKELLQWVGLLGPLVVGVIIGLASHSLKEFLENVAKLMHH